MFPSVRKRIIKGQTPDAKVPSVDAMVASRLAGSSSPPPTEPSGEQPVVEAPKVVLKQEEEAEKWNRGELHRFHSWLQKHPDAKKVYGQMNKESKKSFQLSWRIDKEKATLKAVEQSSSSSSHLQKERLMWLTKMQIAEVEKLPADPPDLLQLLQALPSKKHFRECWAENPNFTLYHYDTQAEEDVKEDSRSMQSSAKADLSPSEQTDLEAAMHQQLDEAPTTKKARTKKTTEAKPHGAATKELTDARRTWTTADRQLSQEITSTQSLLHKVKSSQDAKPWVGQVVELVEKGLMHLEESQKSLRQQAGDNTAENLKRLASEAKMHVTTYKKGHKKELVKVLD